MIQVFFRLPTIFTALVFMPFFLNADNNKPDKPTDLVQSAFNDISQELRTNSELYKDNPILLQSIVNERAAPYFNFERMTQIAMGKYWRDATEAQKNALTIEFRTQLVRSYSQTLLLYRNAKAEVISEQETDRGRVMIKLKVKNDRGQPVTLFLLMEKNQDQWQIIDVNVEGVSIVITARSRFSEEIAAKGIDGFIQSLSEENQRLSP
jgi:phospholipid transport system substrate-binding protein